MPPTTTRAAGQHTSGTRKTHTQYHDYKRQLPPIEIDFRPIEGIRRFEAIDEYEPNVFDDLIEGGSLAEICAFHSRRVLQAVHDHATENKLRELLRIFWRAAS